MSAFAGFWIAAIEHLWQTTLVIAGILAIERLFPRPPARFMNVLWSAAFAKLFLPLAVLGSLGREASSWITAALGHSEAPRLPASLAAVLAPVSASAGGGGLLLGAAGLLGAALTVLWGSAALVLLVRIARDAAASRRHGGLPLGEIDPAVRTRIASAAARAGIPAGRLLVSMKPIMPCVVGIVRPVVCIPASLVHELPEGELIAVLSHEGMHRRHREPLRLFCRRLAAAIFCLYPPVHLVVARLRDASELACDEAILRAGTSGDDLARGLARIVTASLVPAALSSSATGASSSLLRERLHRLSNPRRYSMLARHRIGVAAALALVAAASILPIHPPALATASAAAAAPDSPAAPASPAGFDTLTSPPVVIKMVAPTYPEAAKKQGIEGTVYLRVVVGTDGKPKQIGIDRKSEGGKDFEEAALEAAKNWVFKPAESNGKPIEMEVVLPVRFRLQ